VGLGWNDPEYEALGMDFNNRARRMVEQIEVCRLLWTEQHPTFQGKWHSFSDAGQAPMPLQQPIPVWIGAFAPPAILRAAQIGDGWQAMMPKPDAAAAQTIADFKDAVLQAGRDPSQVGIETTIFATGEDPKAWVAEARDWINIGATQIVFRPQGDFAYIQRAIDGFAPLLGEI